MSEAANNQSGPILVATGLHKTYKMGRVKVPVLHGVDFSVNRGEWVTVLGASGSGKSTMLHLLGGLDRPDKGSKSGRKCSSCGYLVGALPKASKCPECGTKYLNKTSVSIQYDGREVTAMSGKQLDSFKATDVGFVFQFYHLLPELTVLQNVAIGAMIKHGMGYVSARGEVIDRAKELLRDFGLDHRLGHRPVELSGGERQRVALARALINGPRLLLADEPTGNLDRETGGQILGVLAGLREKLGLTMVMVTHDEEVAERADRTLRLVDGRMGEARSETDAVSGVKSRA